MTAKRVIFALVLLAVISLFCFFAFKIGKDKGYSEGYFAHHPSDTTFVVDTHFVDRPVEIVKYVDRERPVYIAVHDTTRINDTTFVVLPREVKTYADSTYRAQVSGVQPSLDWIEVYQRTQTITQYIDHPAPRWSFGVTAGPGVFWSGEIRFGIGIVAGVQYRF